MNTSLDSITIDGSNAHYEIIWVLFTLFVSIALAIDFIFGKILNIFRTGSNRNTNNNTTDNKSYQKREISSVLDVEAKARSEKARNTI